MNPQKKKIYKFVPKPRMCKLKDEDTTRLITREMTARNDCINKADDVQKALDATVSQWVCQAAVQIVSKTAYPKKWAPD